VAIARSRSHPQKRNDDQSAPDISSAVLAVMQLCGLNRDDI